VTAWWFPAMPRSRAAVLRTILYAFVVFDVLVFTRWIGGHGPLEGALYQPLLIGRVLPLPVPTPLVVTIVQVALVAAAGVAAAGRFPRVAGAVVFALYLEWMVIAFSYGKVDHDRFALLVALAVLPTVGVIRGRDNSVDERVGWALRCIQVAVVLTYFLAAMAKLRYGGPEWVNSATLMRAVVRRGTVVGDLLLGQPGLLVAAQWSLMSFELLSPLMLVRGRVGRVFLAGAVALHVVTYATITISFLPHVMCLLAFLPLERLPLLWSARRGRSGTEAALPASSPAPLLPSRSG
jgi:hypothetical protein